MAGENILSMNMLNLGDMHVPKEVETEATGEGIKEQIESVEEAELLEDKKLKVTEEVIKDLTAEEETPEEVGRDEDTEEEETQTTPADDVFQNLGEFLKEKGILSSFDAEIKTEEEFVDLLEKELKEREYSGLNEDQKFLLQELEKGVPTELVHSKLKNDKVYHQITDEAVKENTELQKQLIIQDLLAQGWTSARAEKQYNRLVNLGETEEEAFTAKANLVAKEKHDYETEVARIQELKEDAVNTEKKLLEDLKVNVFKQEKLFGELPVTEGLKQKAYEAMTKVVDYTKDGQPLNALIKARQEDPVNFETNLYYLWELTNGFKDITKFTRKANSNAARKLKNALRENSIFVTEQQNIARNPQDLLPTTPIVDIT